ncbi:GNAT family N-acetyltransferase [Halobacillus litoralis]|uniref:GNAT family N-acetyltransferase n=1 Tax=Halobacillus litoralis TaxID=45668 RepID=A0A410MB73_9BACI|nr:GNAT family N-acetyltransferase [Halobacillus litoralis]QAS51930.1 GNAT family N-acetyltransferase [Halobacillus litoralis]
MLREANTRDADALVPLMKTLGYPTTAEKMRTRMERIFSKEEYQTFVWEENEKLSGMIGMRLSYAYHTDEPHVRVIAFAVNEDSQGKGIGGKLMKAAEQWGKANDATTVMLNSGNRKEREATHEIYRHYGFEGTATGFYKHI